MYVIDFETAPIEDGVLHPRPVGFARWDTVADRSPTYYHWGHRDYDTQKKYGGAARSPTVRCETLHHARRKLVKAWKGSRELLFHNAAFDIGVACAHFGFDLPDSWRVHDTLWSAFLLDPNSDSLRLKDLGVQYLGRDPTEQDALHDWVQQNIFDTHKMRERLHGKVAFHLLTELAGP